MDSQSVVAFLGPASSYTHQAAKSAFPSNHSLLPVATIKDVFEAVRLGHAAYGVVPFENSTHGPVTFTLAALADRDRVYGSLSVAGEVYLPVHHYLLGRRPAGGESHGASHDDSAVGAPLVPLDHIARLYSHPQAFGQTTAFVRRHLPAGVETLEANSTSRAAELAAADSSGTTAAISSALAAETTGLDVLARCIEDRPDNTTRFYVVKAAAAPAPQPPQPPQPPQSTQPTAPTKGLVSFTVPHRSPGALADALACFRQTSLNLTSINSLPSLALPFHYLFFVEFESGEAADHPEQRIQQALTSLAAVAETWRLMGTWGVKK